MSIHKLGTNSLLSGPVLEKGLIAITFELRNSSREAPEVARIDRPCTKALKADRPQPDRIVAKTKRNALLIRVRAWKLPPGGSISVSAL